MAETIRERIERHRPTTAKSFEPDMNGWCWGEYDNGNLIPRDEHEAAVAEAVRAERERALDVLRYKAEAAKARGAMNEAGGYLSAARAIETGDG